MNKYRILAFSIFASAIIISFVFTSRTDKTVANNSSNRSIIIDAGHGYPDGGAVASDGTVESELNLDIAKRLYNKFSDLGFECHMTRNDENSVYSEGSTIHSKKVSDIRNRVEFVNKHNGSLLISIHMNTYPSDKVRGTQLFYNNKNGISYEIANECQNAINTVLQNDNHKVSKLIPPSIYLFKNIKNEAVLIECGFITNDEDLKKLKNDDFKEKLTTIITECVTYKLNGSDING